MKNISTNEIVNQELKQIIFNRNFANAYIFHGPENFGKKETSIQFIAELMRTERPEFEVLTQVRNNNHPDYLLVEPSYLIKGNLIKQSEIDENLIKKNKPLIRIDQIRTIKIFLSRTAIQASKKYVVIYDAHLLNEAASNCLLKTLEEPTNGLFILLTSNINLLLETIRSRCQQIRFKPFSNNTLTEFIYKNENASDEKKHIIENLIFISSGSPGKLKKNLDNWRKIPTEIKSKIGSPLINYYIAFSLAKDISDNLDFKSQYFLINYLQYSWWRISKNKNIVQILDGIGFNLKNNLSPRLSWEVGLLKMIIKDYKF